MDRVTYVDGAGSSICPRCKLEGYHHPGACEFVGAAFARAHPVRSNLCVIRRDGECSFHNLPAWDHETFGESWPDGTPAGGSAWKLVASGGRWVVAPEYAGVSAASPDA